MMEELPIAVSQFLNRLAFSNCLPAYLLIDPDGNLTAWGGHVEAYGLDNLRAGEPIGQQVDFLEGIFPLDGKVPPIPCMHTASGRPADIHLFSAPEGDCALLVDVTQQEKQQRLMQQKGNELSLSYQRLM